ncbi:MAG: SLC13 family permease [Halobacteriales archaeon]
MAVATAVAQLATPSTAMLVVFAIVGVALVLFVLEPIPLDVTALAVLVLLVALEPWTGVDLATGLSGFSSPATVTVLAMFVLSEGVRRTGVIALVGRYISEHFGDNPTAQLGAVLGLAGTSAGAINNTPVVAVMIPMVEEIANRTGVSPSRLLMPVSFAAMMGGMLTLVGTSTNLLASDVYDRLGPEFEAFSMFEFTALGLLVLVVGIGYLLVVGQHLVPERVGARRELTAAFDMSEYLTEVVVEPTSAFVGRTVEQCLDDFPADVDLVQLVRDGEAYPGPLGRKEVREGDIFVLRTDRETLATLIEQEGLGLAPDAVEVTDETLAVEDGDREEAEEQHLFEVVIAPDADLVGETLETVHFRNRYHATVLAIRRGGRVIHARMDERRLRAGDTLLIQAPGEAVDRFLESRNFIVIGEFELPAYRRERLPVALAIVALVVLLPGLGVVPIVHSALAGFVAMVATGCLRPGEIYEAVDWGVVILLAGLIPLGAAMERSGAAPYLADGLVAMAGGVQPVALLGVIYLVTAALTQVVSNNASVVVMIPVAVDVAISTGANPFAFALAVTFAASTAFMTPMGYQTNLMVYGPGGYRFTDFARVGGPLQLLLAVITAVGIAALWGV